MELPIFMHRTTTGFPPRRHGLGCAGLLLIAPLAYSPPFPAAFCLKWLTRVDCINRLGLGCPQRSPSRSMEGRWEVKLGDYSPSPSLRWGSG